MLRFQQPNSNGQLPVSATLAGRSIKFAAADTPIGTPTAHSGSPTARANGQGTGGEMWPDSGLSIHSPRPPCWHLIHQEVSCGDPHRCDSGSIAVDRVRWERRRPGADRADWAARARRGPGVARTRRHERDCNAAGVDWSRWSKCARHYRHSSCRWHEPCRAPRDGVLQHDPVSLDELLVADQRWILGNLRLLLCVLFQRRLERSYDKHDRWLDGGVRSRLLMSRWGIGRGITQITTRSASFNAVHPRLVEHEQRA